MEKDPFLVTATLDTFIYFLFTENLIFTFYLLKNLIFTFYLLKNLIFTLPEILYVYVLVHQYSPPGDEVIVIVHLGTRSSL